MAGLTQIGEPECIVTLTFKRQRFEGLCTLCGHAGAYWVLAGRDLPSHDNGKGMIYCEFCDDRMGITPWQGR